MNERQMQVKMNGYPSTSYDIIGRVPQGSIFGQLLYIIGSDDVSDDFPEDDKYKYIYDLTVLDAVKTSHKLVSGTKHIEITNIQQYHQNLDN